MLFQTLTFRCFFVLSFLCTFNNAFLIDETRRTPIKVAAFNIQNIGVTKLGNDTLLSQITSIVSQYDVILIQEVRDLTHELMGRLIARLNSDHRNNNNNGHANYWNFISSTPVGRTSYVEQYVFLYKTSSVAIESVYQFPDKLDVYEREPFAIEIKYFSVDKSQSRNVILAGIHVKPTEAREELKELNATIRTIDEVWPHADGTITMGDFNADCSYLAGKYRDTYTIFNDNSTFRSLIGHDIDTTVKASDCAYDRIIIYGNDLFSRARDATVYDFKTALGLSQEDAERVSDHFPVQFSLY